MVRGIKSLRRSVTRLWHFLDGSRAYLAGADQARDQGRWDEASERYTAYLAGRPRAFGVWVQLGHSLKESGRLEDARQAYSRAAILRPDDADLHLSQGHLAKLRGDMPEAVRFYRRSLDLDALSPARGELAASGLSTAVDRADRPAVFPLVTDACIFITKPLRHVPGADTALFVTHASDGTVSSHVLPYVASLAASGLEVVLLVASDPPLAVDQRLEAICAGIIVRQNVGYDFAAWAHAVRLFPELYDAATLYLVNDSMFGPNDPRAITAIIERIRSSDASVVGLTGSHEHGWHLQSYFLAVKRAATASFAFRFFIGQIRSLPSKDAVIAAYEVPLTARLAAAGFRAEALFCVEGAQNPTMHGWRELMRANFPLVKMLLFRRRFNDIDVTNAVAELVRAGFDIDALTATLSRHDHRRAGSLDPPPVVGPQADSGPQADAVGWSRAGASALACRINSALGRRGRGSPSHELRQAGVFDDHYYRAANPAVESDPLSDYLADGWRRSRTPNALFDPVWYRQTYRDVTADTDPLLHYVRQGAVENRNPGPSFDTDRYRRAQRLLAGANPLGHAIRIFASVLRHSEQRLDVLRGGRDHVLIVAELSIPQCRKYRVDQKKELLERLGADATIVSWTDAPIALALLESCTSVIFYRTPGDTAVLSLIAQAQARGIPTYWDVDDLIFDANEYILNRNLRTVSGSVQLGVLAGVPSYRAAMIACGAGIASTPVLAAEMRKAGLDPVFVVHNALDASTLAIADAIRAAPARRVPSPVRRQIVVYGSGTDTHDIDFRECAAGLVRLLVDRPHLTLRIIGDLDLPASFDPLSAQVERLPTLPYDQYLGALAQADVSIAPLEPTRFNDCKSNIKFIESAIVGVPCVCSASPSFTQVVVDGETALLAVGRKDWSAALARLLDDAGLREAIATAARAAVRRLYSPEVIARDEVSRLLRAPAPPRDRLRVLSVNIFYAPRSFGGATIVAEHMAKLLHARGDVDMLVFTSLPDGFGQPYECFVYEEDGVPVVGMSLPTLTAMEEFDNERTTAPFTVLMQIYRPDVVHLHSIQGLGASIARVCRDMKVPYVVTAHDAWWICGRQFMVTGAGVYCNQRTIDLNVCSDCVPDAGINVYRSFTLRHELLGAERILTPSRFFADLYVANGFPAGMVGVNRNGLAQPAAVVRRTGEKLRFGFVGGDAKIKGAHLLQRIFRQLDRSDYTLVLVDNTTSLGFSSVDAEDWPIAGDLAIVPAYTQAELDSFFSGIDVLLFPTQWKESFGLTVREALLRDVWVIATDAGGAAEDIVPGENGDVVPLDDDGTAFGRAVVDAIDRTAALKGHINPHKEMIVDLYQQAAELHAVLLTAARRKS